MPNYCGYAQGSSLRPWRGLLNTQLVDHQARRWDERWPSISFTVGGVFILEQPFFLCDVNSGDIRVGPWLVGAAYVWMDCDPGMGSYRSQITVTYCTILGH